MVTLHAKISDRKSMTKKILIINASPRKRGNIAQMVAVMNDEAKAQGAEVDVIEVEKSEYAVTPFKLNEMPKIN